jgi:thiol-disulfide isomerase/thioredoxin
MLQMLLKGLVTLTFLGSAVATFAGERPFDQALFDKAIAEGKPTIVYFHADWCPTCHAQQPIVDHLAAAPEMKPVAVFVADYDKEVALKKALRVTHQSTFVVFKGGHGQPGRPTNGISAIPFEKAL